VTAQVCYFILPDASNSTGIFVVDPLQHILTAKVRLDREKQTNHTLTIWATDNCHSDVTKLNTQGLDKSSLLRVMINVLDVNDNA